MEKLTLAELMIEERILRSQLHFEYLKIGVLVFITLLITFNGNF